MKISKEVQQALAEGKPVVALESTIISHGLPHPQNLVAAREFSSYLLMPVLFRQPLELCRAFQLLA